MVVEIENVRTGRRKAVPERHAKILVKTNKFIYATEEAPAQKKQLVADVDAKPKKRGRPKKEASEYETKVIVESPEIKDLD